MIDHRRVRTRLSLGETDATWLYTGTNKLFAFFAGMWHASPKDFAERGYRRIPERLDIISTQPSSKENNHAGHGS